MFRRPPAGNRRLSCSSTNHYSHPNSRATVPRASTNRHTCKATCFAFSISTTRPQRHRPRGHAALLQRCKHCDHTQSAHPGLQETALISMYARSSTDIVAVLGPIKSRSTLPLSVLRASYHADTRLPSFVPHSSLLTPPFHVSHHPDYLLRICNLWKRFK